MKLNIKISLFSLIFFLLSPFFVNIAFAQETVTFSGHIYGSLGNPLPNVEVKLQGTGGTSTTTDSSGAYSVTVSSGTYNLTIAFPTYDTVSNAPLNWRLFSNGYSLTENTVLDITLPAKQVTVHVQDNSSSPIEQARVETSDFDVQSFTFSGVNFTGFSHYGGGPTPLTNSSGDAVLWLFAGNYDLVVYPPSGSEFSPAGPISIAVTDDMQATISLVSGVTLSGHIYDPLGNPLEDVEVKLDEVGGNIAAETDSSGAYSLNVPAGTYPITISSPTYDTVSNAPLNYKFNSSGDYSLTENKVLDITLPAKQVTVHVQDNAANPIEGIRVETTDFEVLNFIFGGVNFTGFSHYNGGPTPLTNSSGDAVLWLFAGNYDLIAYPPEGSAYSPTPKQISVSSDQTEIISLQFVHEPPVTTASLTPSPNAQGQYPDPVTVTLSATAAEGFIIANTYYTVDGGSQQTYTGPFTVSGDGGHTITYWSIDNAGVFESPNSQTFTIVSNLPPTVDAGGPYQVNEGISQEVTAVESDPDEGDVLTYAWDLDNNGSFETSGQTVDFSAATLDGPSSYTISVQVTDQGGLTATDQATVEVTNVAPAVGTITAPVDPNQVNTAINTSVNFTDPGVLDTHTAVWNWGDGTISTGTVTESNGSGTVFGNHTYTSAGVYSVSVTVTDDDNGSGQSTFDYVVVYDPAPSGGFLTASGKYDSLSGWYTPDSQVQGDVKFGIQAQYNGGSTPTGQTKLTFKDFDIEFESTSYQWLVVTGNKAVFKGNGTINGLGNYILLVSAIEDNPDTVRFQIKDGTNVIYDTQAGAGDTVDPTTPLTSGSVQVH